MSRGNVRVTYVHFIAPSRDASPAVISLLPPVVAVPSRPRRREVVTGGGVPPPPGDLVGC